MNYTNGDAVIWSLKCWDCYIALLTSEEVDRCDVEGVTGAISEVAGASMLCDISPEEVAYLMLEIVRNRNEER